MKLFKKLLSYIIAFTMVLSLATLLGGNVHAADTAQPQHVITINNAPSGRKYKAYQIFKGDYSKGTLSNIEWGDNVDSTTLLLKLKGDTDNFSDITDKSSAKEVAEKMGSGKDTAQAKAFAKYAAASKTGDGFESTENTKTKTTTITVTGSGYYLVEDTTAESDQSSKNESYTRYIVKVVGEATQINLKSDVPTVSKTVQDDDTNEKTASPAQDSEKYGKTADHSIGKDFNYKLVATIPNTNTSVNDYQGAYKLVFHDTMSKGLTYKGVTSVEVSDGDGDPVSVTDYTVTKEDDTTLENPTKASESELTWKVTVANLKAAKTATNGLDLTKALTVTVIYKAALNEDAKIATPADRQHNDNKVQLEYSNNPNAEGEGTPTGKTKEDTAYVFTYELDNTKVDSVDQKTKLDGAEFELKKGNTALTFTFDSVKGAYRVDPSSNATTLVSGHGNTNTNNPTGIFNMIGLDAGVYTLHETKAPDGYNKMEDVTITIEAKHSLGTTPDVELTFKKNKDDNHGNAFTIGNAKGSILPSTGGMGTTLLYVAGGILVACAAAYVVLNKKRA